ncbi:hypothetical protein [Scytonema sp. PCC 10023]|uniref:hypothetical protein n=1 Tax=Scytonema sp. PCC 10023 TaxID=1680591 RepID=UPI0039C5F785
MGLPKIQLAQGRSYSSRGVSRLIRRRHVRDIPERMFDTQVDDGLTQRPQAVARQPRAI